MTTQYGPLEPGSIALLKPGETITFPQEAGAVPLKAPKAPPRRVCAYCGTPRDDYSYFCQGCGAGATDRRTEGR